MEMDRSVRNERVKDHDPGSRRAALAQFHLVKLSRLDHRPELSPQIIPANLMGAMVRFFPHWPHGASDLISSALK